MLIPVPVVAVVVWYFGQVIHELYEKIQASLAVLSAKAQENLVGRARGARLRAGEGGEARFDAPNREYVERNLKLICTWSMFMPALPALIGVTFLLVLWQGGRLVILDRISLGECDGVLYISGAVGFPDDRAGVRDEHFPARRGFDGPDQLHFEAEPKIDDRTMAEELRRRCRCMEAAAERWRDSGCASEDAMSRTSRRSAATSNSGI